MASIFRLNGCSWSVGRSEAPVLILLTGCPGQWGVKMAASELGASQVELGKLVGHTILQLSKVIILQLLCQFLTQIVAVHILYVPYTIRPRPKKRRHEAYFDFIMPAERQYGRMFPVQGPVAIPHYNGQM